MTGHPHDPATYADKLNPLNAKLAAEAARKIAPNFDRDQQRIRDSRVAKVMADTEMGELQALRHVQSRDVLMERLRLVPQQIERRA